MATRIDGINGLRTHVGKHLGHSDWVEVTEERINRFAGATGDHRSVDADVDRAGSDDSTSPIAPDYLILSLTSVLFPQVVDVTGFSMGVNYGCDRVRFLSRVPAEARLRLGAELVDVTDIEGGAQSTYELTFEVQGEPDPTCIAEVVLRSYL